MEKFRIRVMNRIAAEGLALFGDRYEVGAEMPDPDAILVRSSEVDTAAFPSIMAVARAGAGVNNITVEAATGRGIAVFNTPGANANAVAELVFIMLGIYARNIHRGFDFCRGLASLDDEEFSRQVEKNKAMFRGFELAGKTLGVLGLGKIGVHVANHGRGLGMQVVGFDPMPAISNIHELSPEVDLVRSQSEVVRRANILSLHMPYNKKTHALVDSAFLARMQPDSILVNYARGAIVDAKTVIDALNSGHLAGYITDFPAVSMLSHPKILFTPHLGASTGESEEQCATMAVQELKSYLESGNVTRSVNFPTIESIPPDKAKTRLIMINRDVPGMIGFVSQLIGSRKINIASYQNESNGVIGYNIIDIEDVPPDDLLAEIAGHSDVIRVRAIPLSTSS